MTATERGVTTTTLGELHVGDVIRHEGEACIVGSKAMYVEGPESGKVWIRYYHGPAFAWTFGHIEGRAGELVELVRRRKDAR